MLNYLLVASGGALGALARYVTVVFIQTVIKNPFPFGTLVVNCIGSFIMGLIMPAILERLVNAEIFRLFICIGFLGGYTTFSSFSSETWSLYSQGQFAAAVVNLVLNNILAIAALIAGIITARALVPSF